MAAFSILYGIVRRNIASDEITEEDRQWALEEQLRCSARPTGLRISRPSWSRSISIQSADTGRFPQPLNGEIEDQIEQNETGVILYGRNQSLLPGDLDVYFIPISTTAPS